MKVLVVAAHPDDELLGVGGTLARHARRGDEVHVLICGEGATSRGAGESAAVTALQAAARAAAAVIGAAPPVMLGLPDNRLDSLPRLEVIQAIDAVLARVAPEVVYTHHGADLNVDHRIVHEAVRVATRPLPGCPVRAVYGFETVSSTEWGLDAFRPTRFVDISATLDAKLAALRCYPMEMRPFPHARSEAAVEALARTRGAANGVAAAEAFEVLRELWPDTAGAPGPAS